MKITHKLVLLILLGFIGNLIIGTVGIRQLSDSNDNLQYVMVNTLPSLRVLNSIDRNILQMRVALRTHLMAKTPEARQVAETHYREAIQKLTAGMDQYANGLISDDTDGGYFKQAKTYTEQYISSSEAALAALRPQRAGWAEAVGEAKAWLSAALDAADRLEVGHGIGPVHHFHAWW